MNSCEIPVHIVLKHYHRELRHFAWLKQHMPRSSALQTCLQRIQRLELKLAALDHSV